MSIRNLEAIFRPSAIALIGASTREHSVGAVMAENLARGGFAGPVMPVNPAHRAVAGILTYPDVASLPITPELAVICTPAPTIPRLIADLAARGTKGAIVVSAGFKELGSKEGLALQQAMLDAARPHLLRIIGPNGIGVLSTPLGINASFAHIAPKKGNIAFVAQSGAMLTTVLDWAGARAIGFSHLVSLGDMADVDFGDMLDYLVSDDATHVILLYVEAVTEARKFMSAARAAARTKPVLVIKSGRHAAAAKAALSHTGALAGSDAVYDAAFRRAGLVRVLSLEELFDAVETLATARVPEGGKLAILTNGGGLGVLATDSLLDRGGVLAELCPQTIARLDTVLPATWSHGNPVDIIGDAPAKRYADAFAALIAADEVDAVLVLNCPTAIASGAEAASAIVSAARGAKKTVLTSWAGEVAAAEARRVFQEHRVATYDTPDKAVSGFSHLLRYAEGQRRLLEVPPATSEEHLPDLALARKTVAAAVDAGQRWLDEPSLCAIFAAYGIPSARAFAAASEDEAAEAAERMGGKVALKIQSPDISHKSDVGGVVLGLSGADDVRHAARAMRKRVQERAPQANILGFLVQEMIERPGAFELIVGMTVDPLFGPVILFGRGGTAVEVIKDNALGLAPLNPALAREMIAATRVYRELKGYRDRAPAHLDSIVLVLCRLSELACDLDEIQEIEINPLLAGKDCVIALDARARVAPLAPTAVRGARLSIRPYPRDLERRETIPDIGEVLMRPIRPEDATALDRFFARLSHDDVRSRFFTAMHELPPVLKARLTQLDYDRQMAFLVIARDEVLGIGRLSSDPDNREAEFSITVRSDLKGRGLGTWLLKVLIAYAHSRGTGSLFGLVLAENQPMLALCRDLGFALETAGAGLTRARLDLTGSRSP